MKNKLSVSKAMCSSSPFTLVSRSYKPEDTVVLINGTPIGGELVTVIAGPCAVEDRAQMREVAEVLKESGVSIIRGGAFKPRTSPYSFQGLGLKGLEILSEIRTEYGLAIVTEVMSPGDIPVVAEYADILQVGSRNAQNFDLLRALGKTHKPVLLKRGIMSQIDEWLLAAEYIMLEGNDQIILCERGIRTFEPRTRNTFDVTAIPVVQHLSHLPIIADPSHATGKAHLAVPVAKAAVAAGADGLLIETHPHPERALSDAPQSIPLEEFPQLLQEIRLVAQAVGRDI